MQHASTCSCSRRHFLRGCGVTMAGFGLASLFPRPFMQQALAGQLNTNRRLLFLFLRGGNDGINALIPHGDEDYNDTNRPTLFIPDSECISLNDFAYLHPSLQNMMDSYTAGDLALLHRVGYPNNSQSHFDGQRIWENGDPAQAQLFEGWLYRYIQDNAISAGVNLPAVSVQPLTPLLLNGQEKFVNIADPNNFDYIIGNRDVPDNPKSVKYRAAWRNTFTNLVGLEPYRPVLSQTGVKLLDTLNEYDSWDQQNWDPKDPDTGWSLFPVDEASDQVGFESAEAFDFFRQLKVATLALLESDSVNNNGTRIAGTQLGGWDLHNNQGQMNGRHAQLLSWLAYAFKSLRVVLSGAAIDPDRSYSSIWDDTLVVTLSEFGRTTVENGSTGTDHASASCMFLQGGTVNGGVYNCESANWPEGVMFGVDGRYLLYETDYRAVLWEILRDHMGANPGGLESIFPGYTSAGLANHELGLIQTV